jgi:hypothetical protein
LSGPLATTHQITPVPGSTYCFRVATVDALGNATWSAERCTAAPVDNPSLTGSGWTRKTGQTGYYRKTFSTTTTKGRVLTLANVRASRVSVWVTTCSTCGSVEVRYGGKLVYSGSLYSRSTRKMVLKEKNFGAIQALGNVTIKVTSANGKVVTVDAVGVAQS